MPATGAVREEAAVTAAVVNARWDASRHGKLPEDPAKGWQMRQSAMELALARSAAVERWSRLVDLASFSPWRPEDVAVLLSNQQAVAAEWGVPFSVEGVRSVLNLLPFPYLVRVAAAPARTFDLITKNLQGEATSVRINCVPWHAREDTTPGWIPAKLRPENPVEAFALHMHLNLFNALADNTGCVFQVVQPWASELVRFVAEGDAEIRRQTGDHATWVLASEELVSALAPGREVHRLSPWLDAHGLSAGVIVYSSPLIQGRKAIIGRKGDQDAVEWFCPHVLQLPYSEGGLWAGSGAIVAPAGSQLSYATCTAVSAPVAPR